MTDTRNRLIAATNESFRRRGYHGTSIADVTGLSGVTTGSLYHHFPGGKAELAAAVLAETGAAYGELFDLITGDIADPAEAVRAFFAAAAEALSDDDFVDLCPIGTVAREVASSDEVLRQVAAAVIAGWIGRLTARFVAAGMTADPARELATTVVATVEGTFVVARTLRDAELVRRAGEHLATAIRDRVAAPVLPRPASPA